MTTLRARKIHQFGSEGSVSLAEAGRLVGRCSRTIRRWCDAGRIRWAKDEQTGQVFICRKSLTDYIASLEV